MESGFNIRTIKLLFVDMHPLTKIFLLFFGMLSIFFVITFLGMLIAVPAFNLSLNDMNELVKDNLRNADIGFIKYFQSIQSLGFFVIPGILFSYMFFKNSESSLDRPRYTNSLVSLVIFMTLVSLVPLISRLVAWNSSIQLPSVLSGLEATLQNLENDASELTEKILAGATIYHYLLNLLVIAVLPAIGEEFIFRGLLQKILADWTKNSFIAILVASAVFSAFHMQFYGFIPRLFLGIYFGLIFYWSKNIWLAVWAHFLNNAMAVSLYYLSIRNIEFFPNYFGEESFATVNLVAGSVFSILFLWITWSIFSPRVRLVN